MIPTVTNVKIIEDSICRRIDEKDINDEAYKEIYHFDMDTTLEEIYGELEAIGVPIEGYVKYDCEGKWIVSPIQVIRDTGEIRVEQIIKKDA